MPSMTPIWVRYPATPRDTGDQVMLSSLPRMVRAIWKPQR